MTIDKNKEEDRGQEPLIFESPTKNEVVGIWERTTGFLKTRPFLSASLVRLVAHFEICMSGILSGTKERLYAGVLGISTELTIGIFGDKVLHDAINWVRGKKTEEAGVEEQAEQEPPPIKVGYGDHRFLWERTPLSDMEVASCEAFDKGLDALNKMFNPVKHPKTFAMTMGFLGTALYAKSGITKFIDSGYEPEHLIESVKGIGLNFTSGNIS